MLIVKRPRRELKVDLSDMTAFIWAAVPIPAQDVTTLKVRPFRCQSSAHAVPISSTCLSANDGGQHTFSGCGERPD